MSEEEWRTLNFSLNAPGGYLMTKTGNIIAIVHPDGTHEIMPGMAQETVTRWESFGIYDPIEQTKLSSAVDNLIAQLEKNRNT